MAAETLKMKSRDELVRLTEADLGVGFGTLNSRQQSIAVAKFYVREIHNLVRSYISDDDLLDAIVDGNNDLGCDLIYRDDGHVLVIQCKHRNTSAREEISEVSHFQAILERFRNSNLTPNRYLEEVLADIDWENDTFEMIFVTFSKLEGQAREISLQNPVYPSDVPDLETRCEWKFLDESDLNMELRSARNLQRGASAKTIKLYPIGQKGKRGATSVIEIEAGEHRSFMMALDARVLINAYQELGGDAIFSLNIRNFIGNTNTNKAIIKSAEDDPQNFFLYNNGISCLASQVQVNDTHLEVRGLQVINGAQTVKALVNIDRLARRKKQEPWTKDLPNVLARITEVPDNYGSGAKIREKITQYNNTQNTVKISDFRSNDDVQTNLKQQFGEISRRGKRVVYVPKRTDKIPPNSEIIRLEEFAKSVYAFLYDPTMFSGSSSFLFNIEKAGGYASVFGDGTKVWERMPDDEFKLRAGIYWLSQEFASHIRKVREGETDVDARGALERKWLLVHASRIVFEHLYPDNLWNLQLRKLYKGDWFLGDGKKGDTVLKIFDLSRAGVVTAYKNSKLYNQNFVHRNWMRSKSTPLEIENNLKNIVLPLATGIGEIPS